MIYSYTTHNNIYDDTVKTLQMELVKYGYLNKKHIDGYYSLHTEKAYKKFQKLDGQVADGKFDSFGFSVNEMDKIENTGKYSRSISRANADLGDGGGSSGGGSGSDDDNSSEPIEPREAKPFFNDDKTYVFRKGTIDIVVNYANSEKQKRKIEGVKIRSMSQIIDASGEAIADVYNFVARDIIEYND